MRPSLRVRVAATALLASAAALVAVLLLVGPGLRERTLEQIRTSLLAEARLMAHVVGEPLARGASSAELDALVDGAASEVRARVTIVAPDGTVLADSSVSGPALRALENHAGRPEVRQALQRDSGGSLRHSSTVDEDLLYVAVPIRLEGRLVGVSRVAVPLRGVDEQVGELRRAVALALGLAFVITAIGSFALASSLTGPVREIMEGAREFAAGNLRARIPVRRRDELGELARVLNLTADRLEERLAETTRERARTEAILAAMEDGVLAVDGRGGVLLANAALLRSFALVDPVGRHYVESIRDNAIDALIQKVLAYGQRETTEIEVARLKRSFAVTGVPLPGASGAPRGAVLTLHDVTELHRLERVRRDFVANASHELRTPLTSIRGFVEALEDGAAAEPQTATRFLAKIRTHADRMAVLVQDLLELSRLESGEKPPRVELVSPAALARDVVAGFQEAAARKRIALVHADEGARSLPSDPERLRHILENLVDNAVKYTPEGGHVSVRTAPTPEGGARIEVQDDGPGIPAQHQSRIFERFYRVDTARSRELGGTGLGLAIVKHLAEGMGAQVSVASEPGRGARFSVSLPASPARR